MIKLKDIIEGTCGYGVNGELGEEPAGPHLIKKKEIEEALDSKKVKKELNNSLKAVRKNNFSLARELNKINKTKAKQVMALYKRYIIEYQIRIEKILRDVK